ncbi:MAG: PAS domain-containing protein [Verrucomicrobia bacterium]|nr:PAS domain-containing protein [Verrucomicrobiota bacterium]
MPHDADLQVELQRYRDLVNIQRELICCFLPDTTITFANAAYLDSFGLNSDCFGTTRFIDFVDLPERDRIRAHLQKLTVSREPVTYQHSSRCHGEWRWHRWTDYPVF